MPFLCCGSQAKVDADPAEIYFPPKQESDGQQQQKQRQDQIKQQVTPPESKESEKPKGAKEQIQQQEEPELATPAPAPEDGQPQEESDLKQGPEISDPKKQSEQAEDQTPSQGDTKCERHASAAHIEAEVGSLRETGKIKDTGAGSETKDTVEGASAPSEGEAGKGDAHIDAADTKGDSDFPSENAEGRKGKTTENDARAGHADMAVDEQESEGSSAPATCPSGEEAAARRELSAMEVNVHVAVTSVIMEGIEEHVCELELPPVDGNMFVAVTTPSIVSESVTSVVENTKNKEEQILYGNEAKQLPQYTAEQMREPKGNSSGAKQSDRVVHSEEGAESHAGEAKDSPCASGPASEAEEEVGESATPGLEGRARPTSPGAGSGEHPSGEHPVTLGAGDEMEPVGERRRRRDRRQRRPQRSASGDDDTSDEDEVVPLRRKKVSLPARKGSFCDGTRPFILSLPPSLPFSLPPSLSPCFFPFPSPSLPPSLPHFLPSSFLF